MRGARLSRRCNGGGETRQRMCVQVRLPGTYLGPNSRRGGPGLAGRPTVTWTPVCGSKLVQPWHWQEPGWLRSQPALAEHLCRTGFGENRHTCLPGYAKPAETAPDLVTEYRQGSERAKECLVIQFHLGLCLKKIELLLLIPCLWFVILPVMNSEVSAPKAWLLLSINTDYTENKSKESWVGWIWLIPWFSSLFC